jgi:hypothetical protein
MRSRVESGRGVGQSWVPIMAKGGSILHAESHELSSRGPGGDGRAWLRGRERGGCWGTVQERLSFCEVLGLFRAPARGSLDSSLEIV